MEFAGFAKKYSAEVSFMKKVLGINKKWKWMVFLTSVFLMVFTTAYAFMEKDKSYAADEEITGYYLQDEFRENGEYCQ